MNTEAWNELLRRLGNVVSAGGHHHSELECELEGLADNQALQYKVLRASQLMNEAQLIASDALALARRIVPDDLVCPACSGTAHDRYRDMATVWVCRSCNGIWGRCSEHVSFNLVKPEWDPNPNIPPDEWRYFSFHVRTGIESPNFALGGYRRHGWYNPKTKKLLQVG